MDEHEHQWDSASGPILARRGFIALAGRTIGATVATTLLAACGGATVASAPATATAASTIPAQATTPATATIGTIPPAPAATPPAPPLAVPQGTPTPQVTATSPATATTMPMPPTQNVPAPTAAARAATAPVTPAAPGIVAVRIVDFAFDPATVTTPVGTTVLWTNTGVEHTTTSSDNVWGSEVLERGDTFRYQFTRPGTYPYICGLHPDMQATIIVR